MVFAACVRRCQQGRDLWRPGPDDHLHVPYRAPEPQRADAVAALLAP